MKFESKFSTIFECTLESAFKTPMLCDITKIHTGFGFIPRVTHVENDEGWGTSGSSKNVFVANSISQNGGFASKDNILERIENEHWTIQVDNFQFLILGFHKFIGTWKTKQLEAGIIHIEYKYHLYSNKPLLYPINWIFTKTFWKIYMKRVLKNVRHQAYNQEPYQYE